MKSYQKYHKHTSYSNVYTNDSPLIPQDYWDAFKEEGTKQIYCTMEHGYQSAYFRIYDELEQYNKDNGTDIKFVFGAEIYWVKDRLTDDRANCHMVLLAKNDKGRRAINKAISIANKTGYYYKPRLDLELILNLPKDDVFVTTACIQFWNKYDDIDDIVLKLNEHFTDFYLEIQAHDTPKQIALNKHILELSKIHNIPMIAGTDTHILTETHEADRDDLLKSANIHYDDEDGWYIDMPDYDTFVERFRVQNIFTDEEIFTAIDNTNLILDFEDIVLDRSMKLPTLYPDLSQDEKDEIFIKTLAELWEVEKKKIAPEKHSHYVEEIKKEIEEIIGCGMCDYFLFNKKVIELGINKYGGELTQSGRGSNVAMYLNKLLGFTNIDRISAPIHMYPERFLTKERVLESKTPPDEDFNVSDRQPFMLAQKELLGENGCYDLIAFGTLHLKSAFKMYARANEVDPQVANEVSKQIDKYEKALLYAEDDEKDTINVFDYVDEAQFGHIIEGCQRYLGIIDNRKGHPCFTADELVMTDAGYKRIADIKTGDKVLTHTNRFQPVVEVMSKESNDIYELRVAGSSPIEVTGNHPIFVGRRTNKRNKKALKTSWIPVNELQKGDMIGTAINQNSLLPQNTNLPVESNDFWWLIGRFLGDGWYEEFQRKSGEKAGQTIKRVCICCSKHKNELEEILSHLQGLFEYRVGEERTVFKIIINNRDLHTFVKQFGKYAHGKRFTNTIFDLPVDKLNEFLTGYFSADGHFDGKEQSLKTVSKEMALGVVACVAKAYHMPCSVQLIKRVGKHTIENRIVNARDIYQVRFKYNECPKDRNFYSDGYIWTKFMSATKIDKTDAVYNLSVIDDNSYTVNNHIVHNCGSVVTSLDVEEEIGIILCKSETTGKEVLTALIESITIDAFGWLKNDFLIVDSTRIINAVYRRIGMQPIEINDLLEIIKEDKKVWEIYAKGLTQCINQIEKEKTTQKVMKFKPTNIVELTQFIAGIRPSFKSLYSYLESRTRFQYGIKALDEILQNEYCDSSFILFQEDLMKILAFAGFLMKDTYTIIKAISKKKKKKIDKVKPQFLETFAQRVLESGDTDDVEESKVLADKIWGVVEDFSSYGFNSPHGFSYAIDSVTQAWQKANYPFEFYETVLRRFTEKGEKDKVSLIKQEMKHFNIELKPIKFRDDNRNFTAYKEDGYITQPLNSIKKISKNAPQILYDLRDSKAETFTDLLIEMVETTTLNKTTIEILIKLDYFSEFGTANSLLAIYEKFQDRYKKTYVEKTKVVRRQEVLEFELGCDVETTPIDLMKYEIDCVGYTTYVNPKMDSGIAVVLEMEFNQYGTPFAHLYNIRTGKTAKIKVAKWFFNSKPIEKLDIINIIDVENSRKRWITDREEYELILTRYRKVVS